MQGLIYGGLEVVPARARGPRPRFTLTMSILGLFLTSLYIPAEAMNIRNCPAGIHCTNVIDTPSTDSHQESISPVNYKRRILGIRINRPTPKPPACCPNNMLVCPLPRHFC